MSLPEIEAALCEFCEAIIHELLYQRQIYSSDLFERHRLYDVVVRRSRHLKLNDYIHSVVHSIREPLMQGLIERIAVLVLDRSGSVVERFSLQLKVQPEILQSVDVEDIESALRGCLLKLQYANASLGPCKEGCTFEVVAYTSQRNSVPKETWVDGEPQSPVSSNGGDLPSLVPIKSAQVGSGAFRVQLYAEH